MLTVSDFPAFFAAVNGGHPPFDWQQRLLDLLISTGHWPDLISAPTGSGKSNVVDVHVFANALSSSGSGPRVARRMSVVVNRRALVDQHQERARRIAAALDGALVDEEGSARGVLHEVAAALMRLTSVPGTGPLTCATLRGGAAVTGEWIADPSACTVIAATPDMWGSRLLFRGYGSARRAHAREAGLLGLDSVVILDEAHLTRQLARASRDAARLIEPEAARLGVPGLSVVATTATPAGAASHQASDAVVGVTSEDLVSGGSDHPLTRRMTTRKDVVLHTSEAWPTKGAASKAYIAELAALALRERAAISDESRARTVGVVVNNVDTAIRVAEELRAASGDLGEVVTWVGRMRPLDLSRLKERLPGLFSTEGEPSVAFLVSTMTVEVGVDLDLAGMVTELAPGSSLGQRFGRTNRLGLREGARVVVVGPAAEGVSDRPPYVAADLEAARQWVRDLIDAGGDGAPWNLIRPGAAAIPGESPRRLLFSRLWPYDVDLLAHTSEAPFAEPDLAFWLRDVLEPEVEPVGFVVRGPLPQDDSIAVGLLKQTAPEPDELFPASLGTARAVIERVLADHGRVFRWGSDGVEVYRESSSETLRPRPGDVLAVDAGTSLTRSGVVVADPPAHAEPVDVVWGAPGVRVLLAGQDDESLELLAEAENGEVRAQIVQERWGPDLMLFLPLAALGPVNDLPWAVLMPTGVAMADDELRQEISPSTIPVTLEGHSQNVARRAKAMADRIGLAEAATEAVQLAGLHHDDGKADVRFQVGVLGGDGRTLLAKSTPGPVMNNRVRRARSGLPRGWRHEQYSAVLAAQALADHPLVDIVVRLVGTSHGRGRTLFPHGVDSLLATGLPGDLCAVGADLFTTGSGWADLIESTHREYGVWGCAYLEAIVRAADASISKEGL